MIRIGIIRCVSPQQPEDGSHGTGHASGPDHLSVRPETLCLRPHARRCQGLIRSRFYFKILLHYPFAGRLPMRPALLFGIQSTERKRSILLNDCGSFTSR